MIPAHYQQLDAEIRLAFASESLDFNGLALAIHEFQCRANQPYANFCRQFPKPASWREIPAVPQSAFKRFLLSVAPERITGIFHTSGTTGEGQGQHAFIDVSLYRQAVRSGWRRLGLPAHEHLVLVAHPDHAPHSSLSHMLQALEPLATQTRWFIDAEGGFLPQLIPALEQAAAAQRPVVLLGTALAFLNLFDGLGTRRIPLAAGSYAMETGGFKGSGREIAKPDLYARFGDFLDLAPDDVLNEYGMTELSSQFYTRGLGRPHEGPPWLRAVVFDPETGLEVDDGEMGVLRIFDLANLGSVLAVETQDLALRRGDAFELLGRDPGALPRGCSRSADELLQRR